MLDLLNNLITRGDLPVEGRLELPGREPRFAPVPSWLASTPIGAWINNEPRYDNGLWTHQALALDRFHAGHNVCIATGTASGKSLIFQSVALHTVLQNGARVLVFYPTKALIADQTRSWTNALVALGLSETALARIDGDVKVNFRRGILEHAQIVMMTPDVCHAWLMYNLADPVVRRFLRDLRLVILDEAHTLEGVFGSNFAFLFRRLQVARQYLNDEIVVAHGARVIATTATIRDPVMHLHRLTGLEFDVIGPENDGSPQQPRSLLHVAVPDGLAIALARDIHLGLMASSASGTMITFIDSRKAVEAFASSVKSALSRSDDTGTGEATPSEDEFLEEQRPPMPPVGEVSGLSADRVAPYRAGFEEVDRDDIQRRLDEGSLQAIVSTSALELGIDIRHLRVGLNIGLPQTRKSFRQRIGRIARSSPGAFILIAERDAFRTFGTTLGEYYEASVEPSYLYLDNRFMQFAHARCLIAELDALGARSPLALPANVTWPDGFDAVFAAARPGGTRPREFDAIAMVGSDSPQLNYPLRNVGEPSFSIERGPSGAAAPLGKVTLSQALRECYPGAVYIYRTVPYRVMSWQTSNIRPGIRARGERRGVSTKPRIRIWVNAHISPHDIIDGHYTSAQEGEAATGSFMAECQMAVTEKVEGYTEASSGHETYHAYHDLQAHNPSMRPRSREFRTTGVILHFNSPLFRKAALRRAFAECLRDLFCHEYSILARDVSVAVTGISIATPSGDRVRDCSIAIYDETYGSLRLTERIFTDFGRLLDRLQSAASAGIELWRPEEVTPDINAVVGWLRSFLDRTHPTSAENSPNVIPAPEGLLRVFMPGSVVLFHESPLVATDVEIIAPAFLHNGEFGYRVRAQNPSVLSGPVRRLIPASHLSAPPDGDARYCLWDPNTDELADEEQLGHVLN
jgi:DEAD/DEAH box helicase domain-containing protein